MNIDPNKTKIGIIGAGTMGAGIALAALYKGFAVVLYDLYPESLEKGQAYIEKFLTKKGLQKNLALLTLTEKLEDFSGSDFVIEAAIEDLALKQELFAQLNKICPTHAIIATNTSTLSVTAIASAINTPERLVGMHFFNPAPILPLVEVIRAAATSEQTITSVVALAKALGKEPVVTGDTPGFIVNRVARPYYGEALRLLGERVATVAEIDTLVEQGAGFKMGPFRLMDLIGIDINAGAMQSMHEQTFGEPRYRPHIIQMQMVAQGRLGRKTGRGFYDYDSNAKSETADPVRIQKNVGNLVVVEGRWGTGITKLLQQSSYQVNGLSNSEADILACFIYSGDSEGLQDVIIKCEQELPHELPIFVQFSDTSLSEIATWMEHPQRLIGFDGLFFASGNTVELVAGPLTSQATIEQATGFVSSLGKSAIWTKDSPAGVLARIVCQLINEAAFAVLEGVAEPDVIDKAMRLGVNYPQGLLEWGQEIGYARVVAVLDHLYAEYHEERYRACILLRKWARREDLAE